MKKLPLEFDDPELEALYQKSVTPARRWQMRLGLLMPAGLYVIMGLLDPMVLTGTAASQAQFIHITQGLVFIALVALSLRIHSIRYHTGMVVGAVVIAWTSHLYIASLGAVEELAGEAYLMIIWLWLVSGLNVVQSARMMLVFLAIFLGFRPFIDIAPNFVPIHLFFILAAVLFGCIAGYQSEYYRRQGIFSEDKRRKMEAQLTQSQKMEAIGTLVGGIAHDFNNTLAVITGNIFLVKQQTGHLPGTVAMLETIEKVSFRSAAIIKQLLAFSRKGLIHMQPVELSALLEATTRFYQVSVPANTQFEYINELQDVLWIQGDANQLEQVLLNLLNNARDAVAEAVEPSISVRLQRWQADAEFCRSNPGLNLKPGTYARLAVRDNGCGIEQKQLANIFEPFFTTKSEGTGLGLSMAFGTIQSHGGVISIESTPDQGSSFLIYLPELSAHPFDAPAESERAVAEVGGGTILVADDNAKVLAMTVNLLKELGYDVLQASDGDEAVELYRRNDKGISLVILDVVMPKLGGPQASRLIREIDPSARVIFMTGYDPDQSTLQKELNAEEVIMKPFNVAEFSHRIHAALMESSDYP